MLFLAVEHQSSPARRACFASFAQINALRCPGRTCCRTRRPCNSVDDADVAPAGIRSASGEACRACRARPASTPTRRQVVALPLTDAARASRGETMRHAPASRSWPRSICTACAEPGVRDRRSAAPRLPCDVAVARVAAAHPGRIAWAVRRDMRQHLMLDLDQQAQRVRACSSVARGDAGESHRPGMTLPCRARMASTRLAPGAAVAAGRSIETIRACGCATAEDAAMKHAGPVDVERVSSRAGGLDAAVEPRHAHPLPTRTPRCVGPRIFPRARLGCAAVLTSGNLRGFSHGPTPFVSSTASRTRVECRIGRCCRRAAAFACCSAVGVGLVFSSSADRGPDTKPGVQKPASGPSCLQNASCTG